jgi:hypothetical protein
MINDLGVYRVATIALQAVRRQERLEKCIGGVVL